ncbi:MAG: DMT family transporter [Rhizobiaceae bacterium]
MPAGARLAIFCAIAASLAFTINDITIKFLSGDYALHQIVLIRASVAILITLAVFVPLDGGFTALKTRRPLMHLARGVCVVFANMAFFMSLAAMKIGEATAILFIAPLVITALAVVFLGERVGPRRWIAIAVGLAGVLVIVRPGTGAFQPAALLPLVAAIAYATLHILTRKLGLAEKAAAMAFYIQLTFIVICGVIGLTLGDGRYGNSGDPSVDFLMRAWVWPPLGDMAIIVVAGIASAAGGYLISQAYRSAEASVIAPFEYVALPLSIFWGLTIFGEWPDGIAWLGIALIVASGLYAYSREKKSDFVEPKPVQRVP